ncbi:MAG: HAMP domain-containing histidine kinase [Actinobacteria bacterium]|nr:HAMP domain-containing histidine kinase [Actinomycetota bacterium]
MRTLRARLLAYLAVAAVVSAVMTVAVAAPLTRRNLERRTLDEMRVRLAVVAGVLDELPSEEARRRLRRSFLLHGERLFLPPHTAPAARALLATGLDSGSVEALGTTYLFVVGSSGSGPVVLAREGGLDATPFLRALLLGALGGVALAGALAVFASRRVARPIRRVAEAARRLAAGEADVRVTVEGRDELAALGGSFNEMADDLRSAREAERAFLMSVSHELKTPLTAIRGYAEAARDGTATAEEAGRVIGEEAARLERLVRDLLDLARLDRRSFSVAGEPVDLAAVAREAADRAAPVAERFGVALLVEGADLAPAVGDHDRLLQVAANLVDNALRVTPSGGRVVLRAAPGSLEVADTGPGLDPEDLPRAFDRFYLHERRGTGRSVGSGLGLAIVRDLVEAMGGSVGVKSEPGRGATFRVSLRVPTGRSAAARPTPSGP